MRILLVVNESVMHERMGVMCLSAALKQANFTVRLAVANRERLSGMRRLLGAYRPQVIGYSVMTGEHANLLRLNHALKQDFSFLSVFGGPHATFFPQLIEERGVDAICRGEADYAFAEFCRRAASAERFATTPNFAVKENGRIVTNPLSPLIGDLDALPFADREVMYQADPPLRREGHKMFFASRGCPYDCTYCFNRRYDELYRGLGKRVRHRSPENLVSEIDAVKARHPLNVVWIDDDVFLLKPAGWMKRFTALFKRQIGLPLSCNVRADLVNRKTIHMLRDAGLDSVWMGVECGNERLADRLLKRNITNDQIRNAAAILKDAGVKLVTQNLLGLPVEKPYEIDKETLDLNISLRPMFAWSSILYPYPGTEIAAHAERHGYLKQGETYLETNKRFSMLKFREPGQKRRIENLHKLFGLLVRLPFLRRGCDFLCALPLERVYTPLFYLWYGYIVKMRLYPFRSVLGEMSSYLRLWLRFIRKT